MYGCDGSVTIGHSAVQISDSAALFLNSAWRIMIKAGIIISIHMISMINGIEVFRVPDGSAESALFRMSAVSLLGSGQAAASSDRDRKSVV